MANLNGLKILVISSIVGAGAYCMGRIDGVNQYTTPKPEELARRAVGSYSYFIDPETGKKITIPTQIDTIWTKNVNIADSILEKGYTLYPQELTKLDSIMKTNYAKGLMSVDTIKKVAKAIK